MTMMCLASLPHGHGKLQAQVCSVLNSSNRRSRGMLQCTLSNMVSVFAKVRALDLGRRLGVKL